MNQSIYTERENILPHHAEWLDGCGAVWWINRVRFGLRHDISEVSFIAFCVSDNTFLTSYDESYTHIPTGTEFCERVAEILGLEKPLFGVDKFIASDLQVDISKKETTTDHIPDIGKKADEQDKLFPGRNNTMGEGALTQEDIEILLGDSIVKPIKGMAIEFDRLSEEEKEWLLLNHNQAMSALGNSTEQFNYIGAYDDGGLGCCFKDHYLTQDFTITESPTEFLEYVSKQTGKEYKKTADYDVQKFVANREGMAERLAKAPFTNEELMDLPDEEIGKLNFGKPTYPHKTYRILDSLDGVPLDTRIPLSEWIPPFLQRVLFVKNDEFKAVYVCDIGKDGLNVFDGVSNLILSDLDGHWMRIV